MRYLPAPSAAITYTGQAVDAGGTTIESLCDVERVPGPVPEITGMRGVGNGQLVLTLPDAVGPRGTLAFWLRSPTAITNGLETQGGSALFFELPGLLTGNLWWYSGYCQFNFRFTGEQAPNQDLQLPGVPGPQWFHFCLAWDAAGGLLQLYVNGSPTRLPGTRIGIWQTGQTRELRLPLGAWAMADFRVYDRVLGADAVESLVPPLYRGALDALIGAQPRGELQVGQLRGELLYENPLGTPEALAGWRMEGPGLASCEDGWMEMASSTPDIPGPEGHIVHWCDRDFPADFLAEFEIQPRSELGLVILFFCARGCQGEDLFDPSLAARTGVFGHYTNSDIDCYHVSYYANTPDSGKGRCTSNLRKNSGFWLVDQGPIGIPPGSREIHRISVLKYGHRIEVGVDGRRVIRWFDPADRYGPVLGGGKLGFRQMKWMQARYRNLRVYAINPKES